MVLVVAALVAASGAAWAATIQCTGGDCPGTEQPDVINGSDTRDVIDALDGDDKAYGGGDVLFGDEGNDNLSGGPGNDSLIGELGNDTLSGDAGIDYIGARKPQGTTGADRVSGGEGDDLIYANDGQVDYISCGPGTDTVHFDEGINYVSPDCEIRNPPQE